MESVAVSEKRSKTSRTSPGRDLFDSLLVVTHVPHYEFSGQLYAYGPYVREMDIWAGLFKQIIIAAPLSNRAPAGDSACFQHRNVRVISQREIGGETLAAKLKLILTVPLMAWDLCKVMRHAEAIHVRAPGNLSLMATLLGPLFSKKLVAKFAGQWSLSGTEALTTRFHRWLLSSRWWRGPVTVYGQWPNQPSHVVPFFSSALTNEQLCRAKKAVSCMASRDLHKILFVGRLSASKNVDVLLQSLAQLRAENIPFAASIVGEGPESGRLQGLAHNLELDDCVEFTGGVDSDRVTQMLEQSGILVLASETEGWPKSIVEAMAFGLVTIGSNVGLIPQMMSEGRGLVVPPRDLNQLTTTLRQVLVAPAEYSDMRIRASEWACRYSLEYLQDSLRSLLERYWTEQD